MSKVFTLAFKLVKTSFVLIDDKKKASTTKQWLFFLLLVVLLTPNILMFGYLTYDITSFLVPLAQDTVILALLLQLGVTIIIFSSVFMVPSYLFYAKDVEKLLPLPLSHAQLFSAKLVQIHIYQMGFLSLLILPPLVGYLIAAGFSWAVLIFILALWLNAIVTMMITSLVLIGFMSVSPWFKNKDRVTLVLSVISLGFAIYINQFIGGLDFANPEAIALSLIAGSQSLSQGFSSLLPHLSASVQLLVKFDLLVLVAYVLGSVLFIGLIIKLFASTLVNIMASFSGSGASKKTTLKSLRSHQVRSVLVSLTIKELKLLFRTPVYFFNNVLVVLILPIIFFVSFTQTSGAFFSDFDALKMLLNQNPLLLIVVAAGLSAVFSTMNLVTPTSISREGSSKYHMLLFPIKMSTQCYAKFYSGIIISLIGIFPTMLLYIIGNALFFDLSWLYIGYSILSMVIIMVFINIFGIIVDLFHPKLVWDNEQAAVKQNINFLFTFLASGGLIGLMVYLLINYSDIAAWSIFAIHGACVVLIGVIHRIIVTKSHDLLIEH
jgi:ABC-2 type transport system permease protein